MADNTPPSPPTPSPAPADQDLEALATLGEPTPAPPPEVETPETPAKTDSNPGFSKALQEAQQKLAATDRKFAELEARIAAQGGKATTQQEAQLQQAKDDLAELDTRLSGEETFDIYEHSRGALKTVVGRLSRLERENLALRQQLDGDNQVRQRTAEVETFWTDWSTKNPTLVAGRTQFEKYVKEYLDAGFTAPQAEKAASPRWTEWCALQSATPAAPATNPSKAPKGPALSPAGTQVTAKGGRQAASTSEPTDEDLVRLANL